MWSEAKAAILQTSSPLYRCPWLNDCCDELFKPGTAGDKVDSGLLSFQGCMLGLIVRNGKAQSQTLHYKNDRDGDKLLQGHASQKIRSVLLRMSTRIIICSLGALIVDRS